MKRRRALSVVVAAAGLVGCGSAAPTVLGNAPITAPADRGRVADADFTLTTGTLPAVHDRPVDLPGAKRPTVPTSAAGATTTAVPTTTVAPVPPCEAFTLQGPLFGADSAALSAGADAVLQQVVIALRAHGSGHLVISGHTDERPSEFSGGNQALSEARAAAVGARLRELNLPPSIEMTTVGYGADRPVDASDTAAAYARNRRVEFVLACD